MTRTVGDVARLAGISVRALHHYDDIGLLSPSGRSESGYRLYDDADLGRLQRILAYRALGFELAAIQELVEDGDELAHLRRQAALLDRRLARLEAMRAALHKTMEARTMGVNLDPEEMLEVFGDDDPTAYAEEAEARWGDTDAWRQSRARTRRYGKDDWVRIEAEGEAIEARFAAALAEGEPADAERAMDAAEAHRLHIDATFYDCSHAMHRSLAEMFVTDPRFSAHYERRAEGLAAYVAGAIRANAARHERG
jgi:DNA-binding transcriptional MerR regulator